METKCKSEILQEASRAIDAKENIDLYCLVKKTKSILRLKITMEEQQSFVDADGVRWVRDN